MPKVPSTFASGCLETPIKAFPSLMGSEELDPADVESCIMLAGKKMSSLKTMTSSTSANDRRHSFFSVSVGASLVTNH